MKKLFLAGFCVLFLSCGESGIIFKEYVHDFGYDGYANLNIGSLLNASSAVRMDETTLEVFDEGKALYKVKRIITIYNEDDRDLGNLVLFYDDFKEIDYIYANVRNQNGHLLKSYTTKDAQDFSAYGGVSFVTDSRLKTLELFNTRYPYTIEYEFQVSYSGLLNLPDWRPQRLNQSVESATFTLIDHQNTGVRFHSRNLDVEPEITEDENSKIYVWSLNSVPPEKREAYGPPGRELTPNIIVAPGKFKMGSSYGDASSWESFGKWYYELGKQTRELSDEAKAEIDKVTEGLETEEQIVNALYDYMQEKTRYVAITLGIGGWKPADAQHVFDNGYGECKGLTNFMQAMLEYVGIQAEAVLIGINGDPELIAEFPSSQFNHVILRVTLDTGEEIWLECTSKYLPANNLGGSAGAQALLVTREGGKVVTTPEFDYKKNKKERFLKFSVSEEGDAVLESKISNYGIFQGSVLYNLLSVSERERVEWLEQSLPVNNRKIMKYDFEQLHYTDSKVVFSFEALLAKYANASHKRIFIPVNKINRWNLTLPEEEERTQPVELPYEFMESDSVVFEIPEGFEVELMPAKLNYDYSFGRFKCSFVRLGSNHLQYTRTLVIQETFIPPAKYGELKDFMDKVNYSDNQQLVLVKSD